MLMTGMLGGGVCGHRLLMSSSGVLRMVSAVRVGFSHSGPPAGAARVRIFGASFVLCAAEEGVHSSYPFRTRLGVDNVGRGPGKRICQSGIDEGGNSLVAGSLRQEAEYENLVGSSEGMII